MNATLLLLLGILGLGVKVYWLPFVFLNRLKWKKLGGNLRFAWKPYSSVEHTDPRWFSIAVLSIPDSEEKITLNVFPVFADNIFPTLAQLELRVSSILKAHKDVPLEAHFHPVFRWASCVEPMLSNRGQEGAYVGFSCGLLIVIVSLVGIALKW